MSCVAVNTGQLFRYGPDLPFVDNFVVEMLIDAAGANQGFSSLHNGWYNTTIDIGFWEAATEYTIKLDAKDTAGNELTYDYTVKGLFAGVLDFLKDIWDAVSGALSKAWDAVKSAVNAIIDWIVDKVKEMINAVLQPVWSAYNSWISGIYDVVDRIMTVGDTDDIDVNLLLTTLFAGSFVTLVTAVAYAVYAIECVVLALEYLTGIGGVMDATLSIALLNGAKTLGKLFIVVAISTALVMFGEVLSAVIPHDDPAIARVTATGSFFVSVVAIAFSKFIQEKTRLSTGDIIGLILAFIGFGLAMAGSLFHEYAHLMAVIGAGIAGVGLAIALASPDLPSWVGWLDEGVDAVLFGWAVYDAVGE